MMVNNSQSLVDIVNEQAASEYLKLPVFPGVALELQNLLSDDNIPIERAASVLSKDQALASAVLKMANSAFFSGLKDVRTIKDAILRLGSNQVFNCLVSAGQQQYYKSPVPLIEKYLQISWQHALCMAKGTKWLLQKVGYRELAEEGFLAGLLHDIGKLLLLKVLENIHTKQLEQPSEEFILELLDSMHVEQGYNLMKHWSIPDTYCDVVRDHHIDHFDSTDIILLAVRVVNYVCRRTGISTRSDRQIVPASLPEAQALAVKEIVLGELEVILEDTLRAEFGSPKPATKN